MPAPVRVRDLRVNIKEKGFEPGVIYTLEALMEENIALKQAMTSLTKVVDMLIDQHRMLVVGSNALAQQIDKLKKHEEQYKNMN